MKTANSNALNTLKEKNRRDVLDLFRRSESPLTIAKVTSLTKLSKMTIHKIIEYLVNKKLVISAGKAESGEDGGKRPSLFTFNGRYGFVYSVKISETSLLAVVTDLKAAVLQSRRIDFNRETSLMEILKMIQQAFYELVAELGLSKGACVGIAVGCHGITDSEQGVIVTSPHFSSWGSNIPIRKKINDLFATGVPVFVDNWVRYFAYGDMKTRTIDSDTFLLIGTEYDGVNSGLVMGGRLVSGHKGLSGEIGHMIVDSAATETCVCGGVGCLETAMSLRRMERRALAQRREWQDSPIFRDVNEEAPSYQRIFAAANQGDTLACALVDDAARHFAVAVNNITQICEPDLIIIQGTYAAAGDYFLRQVRERVQALSLLRMDKAISLGYIDRDETWGAIGAAHYVVDHWFVDFGHSLYLDPASDPQ